MLYGKIVEGVLIYAPPEIYDENGVVTMLNCPSDYYNAGYKRVNRLIPIYNENTQVLVFDYIIENDTDIYVHYKLEQMDILNGFDDILYEEVNM